jgi:hypothetical protein
MNFSAIRDYVKGKILEIDPTFREWQDGFNFENVPSAIFDKAYHITILAINSENGDAYINDSLSLRIQFSFKGNNAVQDKIFSMLDIVNNMRLRIINLQDLNTFNETYGDNTLQRIIPLSLNVQPLNSNDDRFIISLDFNIVISFTYCN